MNGDSSFTSASTEFFEKTSLSKAFQGGTILRGFIFPDESVAQMSSVHTSYVLCE